MTPHAYISRIDFLCSDVVLNDRVMGNQCGIGDMKIMENEVNCIAESFEGKKIVFSRPGYLTTIKNYTEFNMRKFIPGVTPPQRSKFLLSTNIPYQELCSFRTTNLTTNLLKIKTMKIKKTIPQNPFNSIIPFHNWILSLVLYLNIDRI